MIGTKANFFQSNLTQRIDELIQRKMPTRDMYYDSIAIAKDLGIDEIDYKSLQPIRSYLNSLVTKKLLTVYGNDQALSLMPRIYYIDQEYQKTYWSNKR